MVTGFQLWSNRDIRKEVYQHPIDIFCSRDLPLDFQPLDAPICLAAGGCAARYFGQLLTVRAGTYSWE